MTLRFRLRIIKGSKSEAARATCNHFIQDINNGRITIEEARNWIRECNDNIVRNRMALRFGRLMKEGKIHERP